MCSEYIYLIYFVYLYMQTKICTKCTLEKLLNEFSIDKRQKLGHRPECRECSRNSRKEKLFIYRETNKARLKEIKRNSKIRTLYGLEKEDFEKMVLLQDNKCAICSLSVEVNLCIDHCHVTGKVRGLLCKNCNLAIGNFKDDVELLQKAIKYLEKYKK